MWWYMTGVLTVAVVAGVLVPAQGSAHTPESLGRAITALIPEAPVMVEIARCESGLRQYREGGGALRGGLGGMMVGLFQLHETYHRQSARAMGYNIDTLLGNIAYARELYRTQGTTPWNSSASCWEKSVQQEIGNKNENTGIASTAAATTSEMTRITALRFGMRDPVVRTLHQQLAQLGYPATPVDGAQQDYFGVVTFKALARFQCEKGIACLTDPKTRTQVGKLNERTISALYETTS